jgi:hypothetical protein
MEKIRIKTREAYEDYTIYFSFSKEKDLHVLLLDLVDELGINERKAILELDQILEIQSEAYYYVFSNKYKINIFLTDKLVHLVIHSRTAEDKKNLIKVIRNYFVY